MESLLAKALESKLKYWLKTFTRDQFKLQGRSVLLHNLDLNGDVLHASIGLPPSLRVDQARVRKFELKLPSFSNVKTEPTVVEIDKLDIVLVEKAGNERVAGNPPSAPTAKSTSYSLADKIADGMTIRVATVNLMLETRGGSGGQGGAAWIPPLASITISNLVLYTTNEHWKVVSLNVARSFSINKKCIYVFKRLQWESLSIDLLPHPDMFKDDRISSFGLGDSTRDNDGARRLFFGGERFLDKISGAANITMKRTEQNNPLALEVQLQLPEALCPCLSEPGLRALLRFMTGIYVCLNRADVDPKNEQSADAAGRSMVAVHVEHIFLCIKEAEFQLELLMQSLHYVRATVSDGEITKTMARLELGAMFVRDSFSRPTCTLIQPSMRNTSTEFLPVPSFASEKLWPRTYPLETELIPRTAPPMLCMYSSQTTPSPLPPNLASQTMVQCQPLKINLQEESCLRIASFISDGIAVEPGVVLPDTSLNAFYFNLKEFDATIPVNTKYFSGDDVGIAGEGFTGARLHVEGFVVAQSPFLTYRLLQLEKDPACFALWKGQPVDASQQKWVMRASLLSIALETASCDDLAQSLNTTDWATGLWICVEMREPFVEIAMASNDGSALVTLPPPGGTVRLGVACKRYMSNTSSEQLLFVLKMYAYMEKVSESLLGISKSSGVTGGKVSSELVTKGTLARTESASIQANFAPADTAVVLSLDVVELKLLESVPGQITVEGPLLVRILSGGICLKVSHRIFGGAAEVSSSLRWQDICVECVETELDSPILDPLRTPIRRSIRLQQSLLGEGDAARLAIPDMRAVLWIGTKSGCMLPTKNSSEVGDAAPFLDINVSNFIPYKSDGESHTLKVSAKVSGIRLGGGMVYNEALLHRFGVLGPDGGPGEDVTKLLNTLSTGPLADLFRPSPTGVLATEEKKLEVKDDSWEVGMPDNIDIDLQLRDWLFVLEGVDGVADSVSSPLQMDAARLRQDKCWHSTFRCFRIIACSDDKSAVSSSPVGNGKGNATYPVTKITVKVEGLQALKPHTVNDSSEFNQMVDGDLGTANPRDGQSQRLVSDQSLKPVRNNRSTNTSSIVTGKSGLDFQVQLVTNDSDLAVGEWAVDNLRVAVEEPVEVEATKLEVEALIQLCKAEIESASRIAAGGIKLLNLPIGQSAIEQLSNVGSGSLEKLLTPDRGSRTSDFRSPKTSHRHCESNLTGLEVAVTKSQNLVVKLQKQVGSFDDDRNVHDGSQDSSSQVLAQDLNELNKQLLHMQALLSHMKIEGSL